MLAILPSIPSMHVYHEQMQWFWTLSQAMLRRLCSLHRIAYSMRENMRNADSPPCSSHLWTLGRLRHYCFASLSLRSAAQLDVLLLFLADC